MLTTFLILAFLGATAFVARLILRAPEGHQNRRGFHYGSEENPVAPPSEADTEAVERKSSDRVVG